MDWKGGGKPVISIHALREESDCSQLCRPAPADRISIHALREESDAVSVILPPDVVAFLSTPSARRATALKTAKPVDYKISIHALREESDLRHLGIWRGRGRNFYPRPPRGERLCRPRHRRQNKNISIHALREESDLGAGQAEFGHHISIHALREESDTPCLAMLFTSGNISIHALREESDESAGEFQVSGSHFYPRPPRGERHCSCGRHTYGQTFLSTPSARRATRQHGLYFPFHAISIHALREESDSMLCST